MRGVCVVVVVTDRLTADRLTFVGKVGSKPSFDQTFRSPLDMPYLGENRDVREFDSLIQLYNLVAVVCW